MHLDKAPDAFRTISEAAEELDVPQHVLRFWETRFAQIKPMKRSGGRRYYRPEDVDLLRGIRHLLYGQGYTIRGVQRILREQGARAVQAIAHGGPLPAGGPGEAGEDDHGEIQAGEAAAAPALVEPSVIEPPPPQRPPVMAEPPAATSRGRLRREDIRKLEATLHELTECRRLIEVGIDPA
ncbi:MAG: MerR family transcriptional regulator [Xanthobacteraceae bacterium]|nr:MAG: MerR family transcriptional regulator [Xanthobacteraceae bacterium]